MRNKVNITLHYIAVLLAVFLTFGCSDNNGEQESYVLNKPCLQWGVSQETVKQKMIDFVLLYEDDNTLIYKGKDTESLISYAFETDKLSTANVFVKKNMIPFSEIEQSFKGYSKSLENDGVLYVNEEKSTVGEICIESKSAEDYYCISWCDIDDL